jgi:predicted TIM-barrel fold metal-dependent hydrolase
MNYKIIDFHTHPFMTKGTNICKHSEYATMSAENTKRDLQKLGVVKICGSVIENTVYKDVTFERIRALNDEALALRDLYGDFYVPGFHVHPAFVKQSIAEIERAQKLGVKIIGELVPYMHAWGREYSCKEFSEILEAAAHYKMIVNIHSDGEDAMDEMVKRHKDILFVAAHPGEAAAFSRHLKRMEMSENYRLDLSGTGLFRHGLLRHGIDEFGAERFLFGSDYPTCNPAMFVGGVALDFLITEEEKQKIFYQNACDLLGL